VGHSAVLSACEPTLSDVTTSSIFGFENQTNRKPTRLASWYMLISCSADFRPWSRRRYLPPKRRFTYELHDDISRKMATFISPWITAGSPLWSSGQSSWLQIQMSGFDSQRY
jgi:hypothetical protein